MRTLDEAWRWYQDTVQQLQLMQRLARKYWKDLPWPQRLEADDHFRNLEATEVIQGTESSLLPLHDLAVVVLFSVFEAEVRQRVLDEMKGEVDALEHRALILAAEEAQERIAEGSFYRVLQPFKDEHADLVEQVNQVREHRNWVAHGKRRTAKQRNNVTPEMAYERLSRFLKALDNPAESP
jgi:hypothetical protein